MEVLFLCQNPYFRHANDTPHNSLTGRFFFVTVGKGAGWPGMAY